MTAECLAEGSRSNETLLSSYIQYHLHVPARRLDSLSEIWRPVVRLLQRGKSIPGFRSSLAPKTALSRLVEGWDPSWDRSGPCHHLALPHLTTPRRFVTSAFPRDRGSRSIELGSHVGAMHGSWPRRAGGDDPAGSIEQWRRLRLRACGRVGAALGSGPPADSRDAR